MSSSSRHQNSSTGRDRQPTHPSPPQMPAFLQSTRTDIANKFVDLEWQQRNRLAPRDPNGPPSEFSILSGDHIAPLNRYINIDPYSGNRVKLRVPPGENDYINASPIVLRHTRSGKVRRYIATQGPTAQTTPHFWRMAYHSSPPSHPATIVMLTQLQESGREKCYPYFPLSSSNPTMKLNTEDEFRDGETTTLTLLKMEEDRRARCVVRTIRMTVGQTSKMVYHLAFGAWPDFLVPEGEDRAALVELVRLSQRLNRQVYPSQPLLQSQPPSQSHPHQQSQPHHHPQNQTQKYPEEPNPRIVHCSAGVGRSGTFIALDYLLGELEEGGLDRVPEGQDPIVETVERLRLQRMMMVQGEGQMRFLYEAVGELWRERFAGGVRR